MRSLSLVGSQPGLNRVLVALGVAALLAAPSACTKREDRLTPFEGIYFKAKAAPLDKKVTLADFSTTVWKVSQSLEGARQAAEYEGTKYCIKQYGTSQIDWVVGPDTAPANLTIVDDTLTFQGRCEP